MQKLRPQKRDKKSLVITPEEQLQMDLQLETELSRLQRQHKKLERDCTQPTGTKMARQQKVIEILKKENNNVLTDLYVATSSSKKHEDHRVNANLLALMHEKDCFEAQIEEKKACLTAIDLQIDLVKKKVIEMRGQQVGDDKHQQRVLAGQKTLEALENKLDSSVKRFCAVQYDNIQLREKIEHQIFDRINFNKVWNKLILNLSKGKQFMIDLIEQATIAYNEREEWLTKLQVLRSKAQHDFVLENQEMINLKRIEDNYSKLGQFLAVKGQKRIMIDQGRKLIEKRERQRKEMEEHLEHCQQMLADIMGFVGSTDIKSIYRKYVIQEEENFSMLNFINQLYQQTGELTEGLVPLHDNIEFQRKLNLARSHQQTHNLEELRKELEQATMEADGVENELNKTQDVLKQLYLGINNLFMKCKCDYVPFLQLLGDNTEINDYNVVLHLNMLEEQISDLILKVFYKQKRQVVKKGKGEVEYINEDAVASNVHAIEAIIPTNPCPLCVEQEQVSDIIDTLQFVLTKEQLAARLEKRLALPDGLEKLHNVSTCNLPQSREIIQRRYK